jgi:hypothetical protein
MKLLGILNYPGVAPDLKNEYQVRKDNLNHDMVGALSRELEIPQYMMIIRDP